MPKFFKKLLGKHSDANTEEVPEAESISFKCGRVDNFFNSRRNLHVRETINSCLQSKEAEIHVDEKQQQYVGWPAITKALFGDNVCGRKAEYLTTINKINMQEIFMVYQKLFPTFLSYDNKMCKHILTYKVIFTEGTDEHTLQYSLLEYWKEGRKELLQINNNDKIIDSNLMATVKTRVLQLSKSLIGYLYGYSPQELLLLNGRRKEIDAAVVSIPADLRELIISYVDERVIEAPSKPKP